MRELDGGCLRRGHADPVVGRDERHVLRRDVPPLLLDAGRPLRRVAVDALPEHVQGEARGQPKRLRGPRVVALRKHRGERARLCEGAGARQRSGHELLGARQHDEVLHDGLVSRDDHGCTSHPHRGGERVLERLVHASLQRDGITSCDDYVWKKWQGYAQWEDAAVASLNDPIPAIIGSWTAIGFMPTRSDGQPISANDGQPFPWRYLAGATMPRNAFLSFAPAWLSASDPTQAAILAQIQNDLANPFVMDAASSTDAPGWNTNDVIWIDNCQASDDASGSKCDHVTLGGQWEWTTAVYTPPPKTGGGSGTKFPQIVHPDTVAIHTIALANQAYAMASYQAEQARLNAYADLLSQLADLRVQMSSLESQIAAYQSSGGKTTQATVLVNYPIMSAPLLNGATKIADDPPDALSLVLLPASARETGGRRRVPEPGDAALGDGVARPHAPDAHADAERRVHAARVADSQLNSTVARPAGRHHAEGDDAGAHQRVERAVEGVPARRLRRRVGRLLRLVAAGVRSGIPRPL